MIADPDGRCTHRNEWVSQAKHVLLGTLPPYAFSTVVPSLREGEELRLCVESSEENSG